MATLIHDLQHHAKDKENLALTLSLLFATELNPLGWQAKRGSTGNNSWRIYLREDGKPVKIWYFTGYQKGQIAVRNSYFWKDVTKHFILKTRTDAIKFARFVQNGKNN